jgi:dynamin 1-like protein
LRPKQRYQQRTHSNTILLKACFGPSVSRSAWNCEGKANVTQNPIGDQPADIEEQVTKMVKQYIRNPNCIIVAVSKATEDSANSESLKLAREVDKEGIRTIGVLTQIDLVENSVNILRDYNVLSNQLSLGYVCVYLRPSKSTHSIE